MGVPCAQLHVYIVRQMFSPGASLSSDLNGLPARTVLNGFGAGLDNVGMVTRKKYWILIVLKLPQWNASLKFDDRSQTCG